MLWINKGLLVAVWLLHCAVNLVTPSQDHVPIVLWHGMGDSCCNPLSMGYIKKFLQMKLPGVYVHSLMFGNNVVEDTELGFFSNTNALIQRACEILKADQKLTNGFNAMGFSQGGLFMRVLAQRCPEIEIKNLISIGGPQQGIYGLPYCPNKMELCNVIRRMLNYGAYSPIIQRILVQAQYWHDPFVSEGYAKKNIFLADANCENENSCNPKYKTNLLKIENLVLIKFLRDEMVVPAESEWFGYYRENNATEVFPLTQTKLYKEDLIGLKTLHDNDRLHLISVDGKHLQMRSEDLSEIVKNYLTNNNRY